MLPCAAYAQHGNSVVAAQAMMLVGVQHMQILAGVRESERE